MPANVVHKENFLFPEIKNLLGIFIIDFIGVDISARTIIKKGNLTLIYKTIAAG